MDYSIPASIRDPIRVTHMFIYLAGDDFSASICLNRSAGATSMRLFVRDEGVWVHEEYPGGSASIDRMSLTWSEFSEISAYLEEQDRGVWRRLDLPATVPGKAK